MRALRTPWLALAVALLAGCATTSAAEPFREVAEVTRARTGHAVRWNQGTVEDREAEKAIDRLLARDLTADAAVQIALLGSPELQVTFEELAVSRADLVQAGLLANPSLTVGRTAWESEHIAPNLFASVEQEFLSVLTMPLRKRVAAAELEATKLAVGDQVLALAAEVRSAFYAAQAAEQVAALRAVIDEAAKTSAELATRQNAAGNASDLALANELALAAQASLDRKRADGDAAALRAKLDAKMGLWGRRTAWSTAKKLPELPKEEVALERLESAAVTTRLDLGAARRNLQAMEYALDLAKTTRWVGSVSIGVEAGRLRHNGRVAFGPSATLEIPLFDQRQAQIAKLESHVRRARRELEALSVEIRSDVRAARARVETARAVALEYAGTVVPLRERIVRLSQEQYDAMLLGVYPLIQSKQAEIDAYRAYVEALRDYWIARSDLERAVGARLSSRSS